MAVGPRPPQRFEREGDAQRVERLVCSSTESCNLYMKELTAEQLEGLKDGKVITRRNGEYHCDVLDLLRIEDYNCEGLKILNNVFGRRAA